MRVGLDIGVNIEKEEGGEGKIEKDIKSRGGRESGW